MFQFSAVICRENINKYWEHKIYNREINSVAVTVYHINHVSFHSGGDFILKSAHKRRKRGFS